MLAWYCVLWESRHEDVTSGWWALTDAPTSLVIQVRSPPPISKPPITIVSKITADRHLFCGQLISSCRYRIIFTNPGTNPITIWAVNLDHGLSFAGEETRTMVWVSFSLQIYCTFAFWQFKFSVVWVLVWVSSFYGVGGGSRTVNILPVDFLSLTETDLWEYWQRISYYIQVQDTDTQFQAISFTDTSE